MSNRANWIVTRKTLTIANTQYSVDLASDTIKFLSVSSTDGESIIRFSFVDGQVEGGTNFRTIPPGIFWESKQFVTGDKKVYLSSDTAGVVVEVEQWY